MNGWTVLAAVGVTLLNIFIATSGNLLADYFRSGKAKDLFLRFAPSFLTIMVCMSIAMSFLYTIGNFLRVVLEPHSIFHFAATALHTANFIINIYTLMHIVSVKISIDMANKPVSKIYEHLEALLKQDAELLESDKELMQLIIELQRIDTALVKSDSEILQLIAKSRNISIPNDGGSEA